MPRQYYVYIATNRTNDVLYTGVTNNLEKRMYEHRNKLGGSFTSRYNVNKLVFYETLPTAPEAILAEKKIKAGSRKKKLELIESINPDYKDLLEE